MNNVDNQTLRGRLVGILIFVIIGLALWWSFLFIQNTDLSSFGFNNIANVAGKITQLNKKVEEKDKELLDLNKSQEAVKYEIAKYIERNIKHPVWSNYIDSLVEMYVKVKDIGIWSVELSDIVVDQQKIWLRGKVTDLNTIYQKDGVIDKLTQLEFLSNIQIPSYQRVDNVYEFQIQWEVWSTTTAKIK